jgi:hypothetical protein
MLTSKDYQDRLVAASNPIDSSIEIGTDEVTTTRTLPAPADAARFTGPQIVVVEKLTWGAAAADGSRTGQIAMTIPKRCAIANRPKGYKCGRKSLSLSLSVQCPMFLLRS